MVTARERTLEAQGKTKKPAGVLRIVIDGVTIDVDARTITIREAHEANVAIQASGFPENDQFRAAARAWVVARRVLLDLTFDEMIDTMTLGNLQEVMVEVEDESPEA